MARNEKKNKQKAENNEGIQITQPKSNQRQLADMCVLCEKKPAYKTATVDSDLCEECRNGFINTPIRYSGIIAIVLVIAMVLSGIMLVHSQKPAVKTVVDSLNFVQAGNLRAASEGLALPEDRALMGWKSASVLAEMFYKHNTNQNLTVLVDELFYNKEDKPNLKWQDIAGKGNINAPWNKELKAKYDYLEMIIKISEEKAKHFDYYYNKLTSGEIEVKDIPYQEIIGKYEEELAKATTKEEKGIIFYYMLAVASICNQDVKTQLGYCKSIQQHIPECYWLYIDNIIVLSIRAGEYEAAQKYINTLSSFSTTDANYAKRYDALMLRYQGKYNEALAILEPIIADVENNNMYEVFDDAMICELLSGDLEAAYDYLVNLVDYQINATPVNANLYAMLSKKLGHEDKYNELAEHFKQYGMEISPSVDKYIKGEITIEDLFKEGEVVFE